VPEDRADEIQQQLTLLDTEDVQNSVAWKDVSTDFSPGVSLRGAIERENLTQIECHISCCLKPLFQHQKVCSKDRLQNYLIFCFQQYPVF
jgi:hypothetical protein